MKLLLLTILVVAVTADIRSVMLDKHNAYRSKHRVGAMSWHSGAAAHAQKWCAYLAQIKRLKHSTGSGYGKNAKCNFQKISI